MQPDAWQQWQAFSALLAPGAPASAPGHAHNGGSSFAPFAKLAERFNAAARAYLDGTANASMPAAAEAARTFGDFLRELCTDIPLPWNLSGGGSGGSGAAPVFAMHSPALGATRELQLRAQRMADAWRRSEEAQRRLQRIGADALREAATSFASRLASSPPPAPIPEALHTLYGTWIDCAEDAFSRAAHSEPFCSALAEYVNAGSEWRKDLQAGVEHSAKLLDLPTRSEINTLTQRLRAAENELRALQQERAPKAAPDKPKRAAGEPKRAAGEPKRAAGKSKRRRPVGEPKRQVSKPKRAVSKPKRAGKAKS
ncbi:MAG: poly(R)-hydroxyalkanoic acid synthase subunit PhaE [Steroidobacteraceae bacterium]